ncbi:hypothetical protein BV22DRAFT_1030377 [Leucogyrophana mollusca]|uniref:Uncharacterized protein n=1 Tax=Leucogyrophana mollusca TaxID=85980 RepID=A0ACB8BS89_9AGAM|nr:hypothetical protein BV22DRAFT_1030377 [Leucogyrophana mollusca]
MKHATTLPLALSSRCVSALCDASNILYEAHYHLSPPFHATCKYMGSNFKEDTWGGYELKKESGRSDKAHCVTIARVDVDVFVGVPVISSEYAASLDLSLRPHSSLGYSGSVWVLSISIFTASLQL